MISAIINPHFSVKNRAESIIMVAIYIYIFFFFLVYKCFVNDARLVLCKKQQMVKSLYYLKVTMAHSELNEI